MAIFNGTLLNITPAGGVANWVLETPGSGIGSLAYVKEFGWGGNVTTSTNMQTRIARDTTIGGGARTSAPVQQYDRQLTGSLLNGAFFSTTYASSQPVIQTGSLFGTNWNANGGVIRILLDPTEQIIMTPSGNAVGTSIECRADSGTAASSYYVVWMEP